MDKAMSIQDITLDHVTRAYRGKPGCACGCKGKYYEPGANRAMVAKVLRTIQANEEIARSVGNWVEARVGGKVYVVYFSS
jgi:hypothetical protein